MKFKIFLFLLFGIFFFNSCENSISQSDTDFSSVEKSDLAGESELVLVQIDSEALKGNLLGLPSERNVNVYLPKSYQSSPGRRFPVIYFLHGMPAWENKLLEPEPFDLFLKMAQLASPVDFPTEGFKNWVDNLIETGGMQEAIIVMPDARTLFGPSGYLNSPVLGNFEDYIVKDLVSYIDANYRTIAHFNWRAVTGHCAGGYGALNIAMRYPKVFRYVGALSPAHFPKETWMAMAGFMAIEDDMWLLDYGVLPGPFPYDPNKPFKFANNSAYAMAQAWLPNPENPPFFCDLPFVVDEGGQPVIDPELMEKINAQSLFALTRQYRNNLNKLKTVYFDCGSLDELGMFIPNQMLHNQLEQMHVKHQYEEYKGTHISHLYSRLGKAWVKLSNDFPDYK